MRMDSLAVSVGVMGGQARASPCAEVVEAVRRLAPDLSGTAVDTERIAQVLPASIEKLQAAGLFRIAQPPPVDNPRRSLDNVVLTPHTGYITEEQFGVFYGQSLENILAFIQGAPLRVMTAPY